MLNVKRQPVSLTRNYRPKIIAALWFEKNADNHVKCKSKLSARIIRAQSLEHKIMTFYEI